MSADGVMRVERLKGVGIILKAANHNKRTHGATSADPQLTHLNFVIRGPSSAAKVAALATELMAGVGIHKPTRHDAVAALEFVFSLPTDTAIPLATYFGECVDWVARHFGGEQNILSADVHRDEAAPHCHVLILPLMDGRMNGSKLFGSKALLIARQESFHAEVSSHYGMRRSPARLKGADKREGARSVFQRLEETDDPILRSAGWPAASESIANIPDRWMKALAMEPVARQSRPFERVVLSKGKGPKTAAAEALRDRRLMAVAGPANTKPIGFAGTSMEQSLSCVGFLDPTFLSCLPPECPDPPVFTRHRDADLDPANFDGETGEYVTPAVQTQSGKSAANAWVASKLTASAAATSMPSPVSELECTT